MDNYIYWSLLILALLFITYSAFIIKNEKAQAFENSITTVFGDVEFNLPKWWTKTRDEKEILIFERTDTTYDWSATFKELPASYSDLSLQDIFEKYATENEIIFDEQNAIIKTPSEIQSFKLINIDALRVEGTATQNIENRIYIDIVVYKNNSKAFLIQSRSSILNGLLEGPFFEEMILNVKKPK